jgi:hypothetical protein
MKNTVKKLIKGIQGEQLVDCPFNLAQTMASSPPPEPALEATIV